MSWLKRLQPPKNHKISPENGDARLIGRVPSFSGLISSKKAHQPQEKLWQQHWKLFTNTASCASTATGIFSGHANTRLARSGPTEWEPGPPMVQPTDPSRLAAASAWMNAKQNRPAKCRGVRGILGWSALARSTSSAWAKAPISRRKRKRSVGQTRRAGRCLKVSLNKPPALRRFSLKSASKTSKLNIDSSHP